MLHQLKTRLRIFQATLPYTHVGQQRPGLLGYLPLTIPTYLGTVSRTGINQIPSPPDDTPFPSVVQSRLSVVGVFVIGH